MTVPINIPIITTSPPSIKSAKSFIKPEKSGDFEQIFKQKTRETSQADNGKLQNDLAVKNQPQNIIESEVKYTSEDMKHEKLDEENKPTISVNENDQPQMTCQMVPQVVPTQAVPVLALNSTPAGQIKQESTTEESVDLMGEVGNSAITSGGPVAQQIQSTTSSLPAGTETSTFVTGKKAPMLQPETVDEEAGQGSKEVKSSDQSLQPQGNDVSIPQTKPDSRYDTVSQTLSSSQDLTKAAGQNKASVVTSSNEADKGTISDQNNIAQTSGLDSGLINEENVTRPEQSGAAKDKGFYTSAKVGPESEIKVELLPKSEGQTVGVSSGIKVITEGGQAVAEVINVSKTGKQERKIVPEAPPDSPDKAPPESTPGVVTDRIKADPFTGKINEPARLAEAQSTEILRQIGRQIAGSSNNGSQTIRIQLHPEDLGQIELRITSSPLGTQVSLIADQAGTSKLLETHISQLKQTLSDAGIQMADVHVGQQAPQQSFRDPQSSQNSQRQNSRYDNRILMGADEIIPDQPRSNNSLVDYRI